MDIKEVQERAVKAIDVVDSVKEGRTINSNVKSFWTYAGLAVGIISVVTGIVFILGFKDESMIGYVSELGAGTYGADFYTEIAKSTAFAGNAVKAVYEMMSRCFGILFVIVGAIDVCYFGNKIEGEGKLVASTAESKAEKEGD